jgi:glutaredoxin 3
MTPAIRIYSTPFCGYCRLAVALLVRKGIQPEIIDVGGDYDKRRWLAETTGRRTVPQVFINDQSVGGYTDLIALDQVGALDPLLGL